MKQVTLDNTVLSHEKTKTVDLLNQFAHAQGYTLHDIKEINCLKCKGFLAYKIKNKNGTSFIDENFTTYSDEFIEKNIKPMDFIQHFKYNDGYFCHQCFEELLHGTAVEYYYKTQHKKITLVEYDGFFYLEEGADGDVRDKVVDIKNDPKNSFSMCVDDVLLDWFNDDFDKLLEYAHEHDTVIQKLPYEYDDICNVPKDKEKYFEQDYLANYVLKHTDYIVPSKMKIITCISCDKIIGAINEDATVCYNVRNKQWIHKEKLPEYHDNNERQHDIKHIHDKSGYICNNCNPHGIYLSELWDYYNEDKHIQFKYKNKFYYIQSHTTSLDTCDAHTIKKIMRMKESYACAVVDIDELQWIIKRKRMELQNSELECIEYDDIKDIFNRNIGKCLVECFRTPVLIYDGIAYVDKTLYYAPLLCDYIHRFHPDILIKMIEEGRKIEWNLLQEHSSFLKHIQTILDYFNTRNITNDNITHLKELSMRFHISLKKDLTLIM